MLIVYYLVKKNKYFFQVVMIKLLGFGVNQNNLNGNVFKL